MPASAPSARAALSACVISYNQRGLIETCLAALAFADEVVLIDKSSTDGTAEAAAPLTDRVIRVPWLPTVEETRAFALTQCRHDWILLLDDDECLSAEAVLFIDAELRAPRADIYRLPRREYILGRHDERAYYWPEAHVRLFHRNAVEMRDTVHAGILLRSDRIFDVPSDGGVCIHHLSHADATQWLEKTNRYTARRDRARVEATEADMFAFAHATIDRWAARTRGTGIDGYPEAVALLRAVYDLVDRVKIWEEAQGLDGRQAFAQRCQALRADYRQRLASLARPRAAGRPPANPHRRLFDRWRPR